MCITSRPREAGGAVPVETGQAEVRREHCLSVWRATSEWAATTWSGWLKPHPLPLIAFFSPLLVCFSATCMQNGTPVTRGAADQLEQRSAPKRRRGALVHLRHGLRLADTVLLRAGVARSPGLKGVALPERVRHAEQLAPVERLEGHRRACAAECLPRRLYRVCVSVRHGGSSRRGDECARVTYLPSRLS